MTRWTSIPRGGRIALRLVQLALRALRPAATHCAAQAQALPSRPPPVTKWIRSILPRGEMPSRAAIGSLPAQCQLTALPLSALTAAAPTVVMTAPTSALTASLALLSTAVPLSAVALVAAAVAGAVVALTRPRMSGTMTWLRVMGQCQRQRAVGYTRTNAAKTRVYPGFCAVRRLFDSRIRVTPSFCLREFF